MAGDDADGATAVEAQVGLAVDEEEDDLVGAGAQLQQGVPAVDQPAAASGEPRYETCLEGGNAELFRGRRLLLQGRKIPGGAETDEGSDDECHGQLLKGRHVDCVSSY